MNLRNLLLITFFILICTMSCRRTDCGDGGSCVSGHGSITFTEGGQQYTYDCFQGGTAIDSNHYMLTFTSCNSPGCTVKFILGYPALLNLSALPITLNSSSPSYPYIEMITACPGADTGYTTQGLSFTITSWNNGQLTGTIGGTVNNAATGTSITIQSGSFSGLNLPESINPGGGSGICNTSNGFINILVNGDSLNFSCYFTATLETYAPDLVAAYETAPGTQLAGINFQIIGALALSGLESFPYTLQGDSNGSCLFAIECPSCVANYSGTTPNVTVVTLTSITATRINGSISGMCFNPLTANPITYYPIQGTFSIFRP